MSYVPPPFLGTSGGGGGGGGCVFLAWILHTYSTNEIVYVCDFFHVSAASMVEYNQYTRTVSYK